VRRVIIQQLQGTLVLLLHKQLIDAIVAVLCDSENFQNSGFWAQLLNVAKCVAAGLAAMCDSHMHLACLECVKQYGIVK